jgi:hypothetical protein
MGGDYGSIIVVIVTIIHSPIQHLSLLRITKKARVTVTTPLEPDDTLTLMPPIVPPNDIFLPSVDGGNNDNGNDVWNTSSKHGLVVDGITGNSFSVPHGVDGGSSVNDIALFIRQTHTLFKDTDFVNRVRDIDFAVTHHLTTTQRHMHRIFECLKCHLQLKFLANYIPNPEAQDKIIPQLYLLVRGIPTDARMEVLNSVMFFFGESLYLKSYDGQDISKLPPDECAKARRHNCSYYYYFL